MSGFRFVQPIEVRYGDIDPQGHVNNAKYLTYLEQGRVQYVHHLGLWSGESFLEIGFILAEARISFLQPILFGTPLRVGVKAARLGNKSLTMEYSLYAEGGHLEFAQASTVMVTYDYHNQRSIPIPANWRQVISDFEGLPS